jgi:hypothetical protein
VFPLEVLAVHKLKRRAVSRGLKVGIPWLRSWLFKICPNCSMLRGRCDGESWSIDCSWACWRAGVLGVRLPVALGVLAIPLLLIGSVMILEM